MKRKSIAAVAGVIVIFIAIAITSCSRRNSGPRSNVLFITLDTTRSDRLGCYGYAMANTPSLDALAASGTRFTRAFSDVPLTLPSHTTMMSGLYTPEHGARVNGQAPSTNITLLAELFSAQGYQTAAIVAAFVVDSRFGLTPGFDYYDDYDVPTGQEIYDENVMYSYRRGKKVADAALKWLKNRQDKPFFCWVHFYDPHRPRHSKTGVDDSHAYDAEVAYMDRQIKRLLDYVQESGLADKTTIIAVADHGEGLGDHGEEEHGLQLYDYAIHVPLIVRLPTDGEMRQALNRTFGNAAQSREVDTVVSTVDLFSSLAELCRLDVTENSGRSFIPALFGKSIEERPIYHETEFPFTEYGWSPLQAVQSGYWKYIHAPEGELFNLKPDPGEIDNLIEKDLDQADDTQYLLAQLEENMVYGESTEVQLDATAKRALESLGYVGGAATAPADTSDLRNPKDALHLRHEFIRAVSDCQAGNLKKGEAALKELIQESPESYVFHYKLAKLLFEQQRFKEAGDEFRETAKRFPDHYGAHYNLGKTLIKLGQYNQAEEELQLALALDDKQPDAYNNLGLVYLHTSQLQKAIDVFSKSIELESEQVDPHNNIANAFLWMNQLVPAMEEFKEALKIDPNFFEARYNLGLVLFRLKRYQEAAREFEYAIRLRPNFGEAHARLKEARSALGAK